MLLWELLSKPLTRILNQGDDNQLSLPLSRRLPYETRCSTITKSGKRCRGKIRKGSEFCSLHDPEVAERRRSSAPPSRNSARYRLSHLPDGYLRRLSKRAAVGNAMDRLYREVRLGIISPDMGAVLFEILVRLMDSGMLDDDRIIDVTRCKADRLRPKVKEWLTRSERSAWKKAVANAPASVLTQHTGRPVEPVKLPFQAAS
jgi:hypothetical protein